MALHEFKLETLTKLDDGRVVEAWNQALRRAILDCEDRPGVTEARKVILQLELAPTIDEDGNVDTVRGQFQVKDSAPVRKTKKYDFSPRLQGKSKVLIFNDLSDDNVKQHTIDEVTGGEL